MKEVIFIGLLTHPSMTKIFEIILKAKPTWMPATIKGMKKNNRTCLLIVFLIFT